MSSIAGRVAAGLIRQGVRPGDVVGLFAPVGFEWIAVCLGALRAGAVVMPLDSQLEKSALAGILTDGSPRMMFTVKGRQERLRAAGPEGLGLCLLDGDDRDAENWKNLLEKGRTDLPDIGTDSLAALFYTSGTTGPPKGVPLTHGNLAFQIDTVRETGLVESDDRMLLPLPPHHVYPFVIGILAPVSLGIAVVLPYSMTGPQMVRAMREGEITLLLGVPRLYDALLSGIVSRIESNAIAARLFDSWLRAEIAFRKKGGSGLGKWLMTPLRRRFGPRLRIMASGGAPLAPELAMKLEAFGWNVAVGYGLTETSPLLTIRMPGENRHASVGRPVKGVRISIDPEAIPDSGEKKSPKKEGEILAKGPNVFSSYRNMPDKTDEAFAHDGWFRTGDMGFLDDDGYLYVTGRVSTLIVTRGGENIQPDDIESRLSEHPAIREAGVLQLEDGTLAAVIVPEPKELRTREKQDAQDASEIVRRAINEISRELPSYQRVNDFSIVRTPLPRTRLGKIRRHLLAEVFRRAKQEQASPERRSGPLPISEMAVQDRELLENPAARKVWNWLAERYRNRRLSPDADPDLDLGIDSLEWLNITLEIRRLAGIELEEESIGRIDTVRDLLEIVSEKSAGGEAVSLESPLENPERSLTSEQMRWLEPLSPLERYLGKGIFAVVRLVAERIFKLRTEGVENLPSEGPFVITPNHASYLDPFVLAAAIGFRRVRRLFWAGWTGAAFRNPFFRFFSRLSQTVPVDPEKGMISSMAFGAAVLNRKKGLVWFPEGRRSPDGRLQPFKSGVGVLLEHTRAPVVPAFILGTERILPPGKAIPRLDSIVVAFGQPLDPAELARDGQGEEEERNNQEANGTFEKEGENKERIVSALREQVAKLGAEMRSRAATGKNARFG